MSDEMRVGVIGAGYWGPNMIRNLIEIPGCDLRSAVDLDRDRLHAIESRFPQIETTTTDYEVLFDLDIDAVAICTPPETHFKIARDCLLAGMHVLVEKPIATSSADAYELVEIANSRDRVLMVGHTFEYNPAVQELKRMMDRGELGEIRYIDAVRVGLGLYHPTLNVIWDLAPHDVSILLHLFERMPTHVSAEAVACVHDVVEDVAYLTLMFSPGILTHIRVSWLDPSKTRRITVVGSEKMVIYDDVEPNEKLKVYDKGVEALHPADTFGEFQFNYRFGDIVSPFLEFHEPLRVECEHFIECATEGRTPLTGGDSGLRVVEVIEAIQTSLKLGGEAVPIIPRQPSRRNGHRHPDGDRWSIDPARRRVGLD